MGRSAVPGLAHAGFPQGGDGGLIRRGASAARSAGGLDGAVAIAMRTARGGRMQPHGGWRNTHGHADGMR